MPFSLRKAATKSRPFSMAFFNELRSSAETEKRIGQMARVDFDSRSERPRTVRQRSNSRPFLTARPICIPKTVRPAMSDKPRTKNDRVLAIFMNSSRAAHRSADFQCAQRNDRADYTQNVKADYDLRFVPTLFLEMVMNGRHQKNAPAGAVTAFGVAVPAGLKDY